MPETEQYFAENYGGGSKAFELFVLNMELHLNAQIEYITPDIKRRTSVCRHIKKDFKQ